MKKLLEQFKKIQSQQVGSYQHSRSSFTRSSHC